MVNSTNSKSTKNYNFSFILSDFDHNADCENPYVVPGVTANKFTLIANKTTNLLHTFSSFYGPIHTRHFRTQYCDKKIKIYCDKKIKRHFSSKIFFLCVLKIFFWDNSKYFEMSLQYFEEKKIYFYLNIFLSFYRNIAIS